MNIGLIGLGAMGAAIARGLARDASLALFGVETDQAKLQELSDKIGLTPAADVVDLAKQSDVLILAVKPGMVHDVLVKAAPALNSGKIVVSIAAGVTLERLKAAVRGVAPVVRVMPNTPAQVGEGVFAVCVDDPDLTPKQRVLAQELFKPLGLTLALEEKYFDAFTALAGSGPAYVFYFMEALIDAAVALGLPRDKAAPIVEQLLHGSAKLALESKTHVTLLKEMVTSPAGTTIAALNLLDDRAVKGAIIAAVKAAAARSAELGRG